MNGILPSDKVAFFKINIEIKVSISSKKNVSNFENQF